MSTDRTADAEDCKTKGNQCLQEKNFDKAIEWYTQAIQFHKSHVYYSNRSAAYLSKGYADTAIKDADTCISMKPDWPKGYSRKAAALHKLRKYEDAIKVYEQGLEIAPGDESLKEGLEQVKEEMNGPIGGGGDNFGGENPFGSVFGPDLFVRIGANPKISKYLSDPQYVSIMKMIQENPNTLTTFLKDPRVMETLSELLGINLNAAAGGEDGGEDFIPKPKASSNSNYNKKEEQQTKKEETEEEKQARELREKADEHKNRGNEYYKKKEFDKAIECYESALQIIPNDMTYMLNISSVKLEQNDLEGCLKQCEAAIEAGRGNGAAFNLIAKAYERMGNACLRHDKYEEAMQHYRKAQVESYSQTVDAQIKKLEQKIKEQSELAYLDPVKGAEAKERGNELFKKGAFPEALKEYTDAIRRDPKNAIYYSNRSAAYTKLMDFGRAKEDCNKALELDPKYVRGYARRGNIEIAVKEYHKALESFQKGLSLDPENEECKEGLIKVENSIRNSDSYDNKERQERAMEDPEIRSIMQDPVMIQVLRDMSTDPNASMKHMRDPNVAHKIQKLIAAGIVSTR